MAARLDSPPKKHRPKVGELLLITVVFVVVVIWIGGAYSNQDLLWFYGQFEERPSYIRIYHYGTTVDLRPGQPEFDTLVAAVNAAVPQHAGYYEGLRPAGDILDYYQTKGYAIELVYDQPVQVHTRYFFPAAERLMIAIDGSYNYTQQILLFRGGSEQWLPSGIALENIDQVRAVSEAVVVKSHPLPARIIDLVSDNTMRRSG